MEIPDYEPFYLKSLDDLRAEIVRLGLDIPIAENLEGLQCPLNLGKKTVPNRFCVQPMIGLDAKPDGSPAELTIRRHARYAKGGFGLIWIESTAAGSPGRSGQLALSEANRQTFKSWVESIREAAYERWRHEVVIVLQLAASFDAAVRILPEAPGDTPLISDVEIERCRNRLVATAALAAEAGFDGVDIQGCHGALAGELLGAFTREGPYGGSFVNRTRFLRETIAGVRETAPDLLLATRLNAYDAVRYPHGFGVDESDYRKTDLSEPATLVRQLQESGLDLLNVTASSPNLKASPSERPFSPHSDCGVPDEHPLMVLARQLRIAEALRKAAPGLPVVGSGFSWLRQFVPEVAAGAIGTGAIDLAGLGRSALAYPEAPADVIGRGCIQAESTCMVCFACSTLLEEGGPVGCVIRDSGAYGKSWQGMRRFSPDRMAEDAGRCHFCEAPPCIAASPTHTDIPAFIKAYLDGDDRRAFRIIRSRDVLPEMTSHLSPGWLQSEGACIETALTGRPVPILDLQYAISWRVRDRGETGVRLPENATGKKVAVVGGGPAGIAGAVRLLEHGYEVDLYEETGQLGGTPQRVIPSGRVPDFTPEIDAVLGPAVRANRLRLHFGRSLGSDLELDSLRAEADAILIAVGVWQERSLGMAAEGVIDALGFLEAVKKKEIDSVANRVAVLSGGDSAMDAADTVKKLGAEEVFIVFGGPRSAMHWHMPEEWFATPGVHAMMNCRPIGYETETSGKLSGLRIHHTERHEDSVLPVDMVIEAMGLEVAETVRRLDLDGVYTAGGFVNGGASVGQCVAEGMNAAETIHADLV